MEILEYLKKLILWVTTGRILDFQLWSFFKDHFTSLKPLKISIKSRLSKSRHHCCTSWHNHQQENLCYSSQAQPDVLVLSPQLQMLNYYNNNTLKSIYYTGTTWNFQAIILLLLHNKLHSLQSISNNIPITNLHLHNL